MQPTSPRMARNPMADQSLNSPDEQPTVDRRPVYQSPTLQTFTAEELLAALGPAQAGSVGGQNIFGQ